MNNIKELELKIKDYKRFIITLLIVSIYLYMGAMIETYIRPSEQNMLLFCLSLGMTIVAVWFIIQFRRMKSKLEERV